MVGVVDHFSYLIENNLIYLFKAFQQLAGDVGAFQTHHGFFGSAITKQIDATIPDNTLIDDCEFFDGCWI